MRKIIQDIRKKLEAVTDNYLKDTEYNSILQLDLIIDQANQLKKYIRSERYFKITYTAPDTTGQLHQEKILKAESKETAILIFNDLNTDNIKIDFVAVEPLIF